MQPERSYGVRERVEDPTDQLGLAIEGLQYRGFAVVPNVLSKESIGDLNERLEQVYARQCDEVGGETELLAISDRDVVRCPLAYDDKFLEIALHPVIVEAARRIIGPSVLLVMQNGVINRPERVQAQTAWHRDLNYQHWVCSRPLAISAMVCLEDFTEETGGTIFLPGSHRSAPLPSDAALRSMSETPQAPAGAVVLFDSMVYHRTGINKSGRVRRGINHVIGAPILAQTVDIPNMRGKVSPVDPFLAGYLGYSWNPASSVRDWRQKKIEAHKRTLT